MLRWAAGRLGGWAIACVQAYGVAGETGSSGKYQAVELLQRYLQGVVHDHLRPIQREVRQRLHHPQPCANGAAVPEASMATDCPLVQHQPTRLQRPTALATAHGGRATSDAGMRALAADHRSARSLGREGAPHGGQDVRRALYAKFVVACQVFVVHCID